MAKVRTFPLDWESRKPVLHFPNEVTPISGDILEIGPGRGDLLMWCAERFPQKQFIGIELDTGRFHRLAKRIRKRHQMNIRLLCGDARVVIPRFFEHCSFERIYVLFPDPWPKDRHAFHRLMSAEFMTQLTGLLKVGGDLVVSTDMQFYAEWVIQNAGEVNELRNAGTPYVTDRSIIPSPDKTFFEELWLSKGKTIFFVRLEKLP